jgi:hypothetical protein
MGWMKESLEEMKRAEADAVIYGNADEKQLVKSSLANLEQEIENGGESGSYESLLFLILLTGIIKKRNLGLRNY